MKISPLVKKLVVGGMVFGASVFGRQNVHAWSVSGGLASNPQSQKSAIEFVQKKPLTPCAIDKVYSDWKDPRIKSRKIPESSERPRFLEGIENPEPYIIQTFDPPLRGIFDKRVGYPELDRFGKDISIMWGTLPRERAPQNCFSSGYIVLYNVPAREIGCFDINGTLSDAEEKALDSWLVYSLIPSLDPDVVKAINDFYEKSKIYWEGRINPPCYFQETQNIRLNYRGEGRDKRTSGIVSRTDKSDFTPDWFVLAGADGNAILPFENAYSYYEREKKRKDYQSLFDNILPKFPFDGAEIVTYNIQDGATISFAHGFVPKNEFPFENVRAGTSFYNYQTRELWSCCNQTGNLDNEEIYLWFTNSFIPSIDRLNVGSEIFWPDAKSYKIDDRGNLVSPISGKGVPDGLDWLYVYEGGLCSIEDTFKR